MSKNIVIIEGVSPIGHVDFNKKIIECLNEHTKDIYVGNSLRTKYFFAKIKNFDDSFVFHNRIYHAVGFLILTLKIIKENKHKKDFKYLLLSYDILALPFIAIYSKYVGASVFACEHNTIPTSFIKKVIQRLSSNVARICFMSSSAEIFEKLGCSVLHTKLPIPDYREISRDKVIDGNYIFCPSASSDEAKILAAAIKNPTLKFLVKSRKCFELNNVVCKEYFDDYVGCIKGSLAVYIPMKNNHRVSGPLLDAISLGKQVILPPGELYDFAFENFPRNVISESELSASLEFKDYYIGLKNYNDLIELEVRSFVLGLNDTK